MNIFTKGIAFLLVCFYSTGPNSNSLSTASAINTPNTPLDTSQNITSSTPHYTAEEKQWLAEHPVIYYSELHRPPLFFVDEQVSGIGVDYLKLVAEDTGVTFQYIPSKNSQQLAQKIAQGEICLRVAVPRIKPVHERLFLTDDYISSPLSIVTSNHFSYVQNIDQLNGLTVSINEDSYLAEHFNQEHTEVNLVYTDNVDHALELVARDRADAFVGSMAEVAHYLRNAELYNLRVSGLINKELGLHFEISPEHLILKDIINKTLQRLSDVEKRRIANTWFAVNFHEGIRLQTLLIIAALVIFISAISIYWIRRLKLEIYHKELVEKALQSAREDAELANKAKSEFLANMSHEIRTPLNAIVGFSQLLSDSDLSDKQKSYLRSIRVGSDGLLHIINDILDLSKIEAGKMTIECHPTDFHKLIEELTILFEEGMKSKGIEFTVIIDASVPKYLNIDANRVRQVLLNIIGNAQKFTHSGQVKVHAHVVQSDPETNEFDLIVDITDTGIGIGNDSLERIFEHFEQNTDSGKHQFGGTGLGLAISKKLSVKMGGDLSVISNKGQGSCFTFRLFSVRSAEAFGAREGKKIDYQFDDSVVLVVDDIESNRLLLLKYLEDLPFEVYVAENGLQAIELAKKIKPNIILMDLRMPVLDGYEATKIIKNQQTAVVIALTASALEDEDSKNKRRVFDAFLRKPVLKTKLLETMAQFLSHTTRKLEVCETTEKQLPLEFDIELVEILRNKVLTEMLNAHKKGDINSLKGLAIEIEKIAEQKPEPYLLQFSHQLLLACEAFDIDELDFLVRLLKNKLET